MASTVAASAISDKRQCRPATTTLATTWSLAPRGLWLVLLMAMCLAGRGGATPKQQQPQQPGPDFWNCNLRPRQRSNCSSEPATRVACLPSATNVTLDQADDNVILLPASADGTALLYPANASLRCLEIVNDEYRLPLKEGDNCPVAVQERVLPYGYIPASYRETLCRCQACRHNSSSSCQPLRRAFHVLRPAGCQLGLQAYVRQLLPAVAFGCSCFCAPTGC